jgi:hypothetical protein
MFGVYFFNHPNLCHILTYYGFELFTLKGIVVCSIFIAQCISQNIARHLNRMTNDMEQTFERKKHFHVHLTLKHFSPNNIIPK